MIIFAALLPAYVLSIFYRSFLSVIAGPVMTDLGIGPREFGLLGASWFIVFAAAQFPIGWALDRLGPRRTVAVAMTVGTVGAFLFAYAATLPIAVLAMVLLGIGCSPIFMASLFLFARNEAPNRFALLVSILIGLGSVGNLASAGPLAIAAADYGWRSAMLAVAFVFLVATVLAAALIRDPARVEHHSGVTEGLLQGLASIARIGPLWLLAPLTLTGYAIIATERGLWVAPFMSDVHGFDAIASGHAATAMALAMVVGALIYGAIEKRFGRVKWLSFWGSVLTGLFFVALALFGADSAPFSILLLGLIGGVGFTYAVLMAHAKLFFPAHLLGRGMTCVNFFFIGGAALAQSGSGWLIASQREAGASAATTFANLHWVFGAALLASAAVYAFAPERPRRA